LNRVDQVKKIREKAAIEAANKLAKEPIAPVVYRKTGCSFCSHVRKKIKDGVAQVKKLISEDA